MHSSPNIPLNATTLIDNGAFGSFQRRVILLCALVYVLDGYDTLAIGYTAPLLAEAVHVPLREFGTVFSTGIFGALLGTLAFGFIGDRLGRKWPLIATCVLFATCSLLTLRVTSFSELLVFRFLTGIGLGGATPLFVAMATEYAPKRLRGLAISLVYASFPLGGVLAGLVSSTLVPSYGWEVVFVIGGVLPLVVAALMVVALPESIGFLIARGDRLPAVREILGRMGVPGIGPATRIVASPASPSANGKGVAIARLFAEVSPGRTVLLWSMYFGVFMVVMTLSAWTPSLLRNAGIPLSTASLILAANSFGSIIGTIGSGYVFDRFGAKRVLVPQLLLSALLVGLYGPSLASPLLLGVVATLAGVFITGATTCLLALSGGVYSTSVRATGTGVALGFGRVGQVLGPIGIGFLLGQRFDLTTIFLAATLPCLGAALAAAAFSLSGKSAAWAKVAERGAAN